MTDDEINTLRDVLLNFEGTKSTSYVPTSGKKVIGNSGVTIGKGLDLGQQNESSIDALGLSDTLATKLKDSGYLGVKGAAALKAHTNPIILTSDEEKELNNKLIQKYSDDFTFDYINAVGSDPAELTANQRLALTSAYFNLGKGMFKTRSGDTQLTRQLKDKDFNAVAHNLSSWGKRENGTYKNESLRPRRVTESLLFLNQMQPENVGAVKSSFTNLRGAERKNALDAYEEKTKTGITDQPAVQPSAPTPQGPPDLFARPPSPYSDGSFFSNPLMQQGEDFLSRIKKAIGWN